MTITSTGRVEVRALHTATNPRPPDEVGNGAGGTNMYVSCDVGADNARLVR